MQARKGSAGGHVACLSGQVSRRSSQQVLHAHPPCARPAACAPSKGLACRRQRAIPSLAPLPAWPPQGVPFCALDGPSGETGRLPTPGKACSGCSCCALACWMLGLPPSWACFRRASRSGPAEYTRTRQDQAVGPGTWRHSLVSAATSLPLHSRKGHSARCWGAALPSSTVKVEFCLPLSPFFSPWHPPQVVLLGMDMRSQRSKERIMPQASRAVLSQAMLCS